MEPTGDAEEPYGLADEKAGGPERSGRTEL